MSRYALVLALAFALSACGGDDKPASSPTAVPSSAQAGSPAAAGAPATAARPCPVQADICSWATKMHGLVLARDVNALVAASQPRMFTCSATNRSGMGGTSDICTGFPDGASRA